MARYEATAVYIRPDETAQFVLDTHYAAGWRLVTAFVSSYHWMYFEREVQDG